MSNFKELSLFERKEIVNAIMFEGATFPEIEKKFGVNPNEIAELVGDKIIKPYTDLYVQKAEEDKEIHKKTVANWVRVPLLVSGISFVAVVLIQMVLGGFDTQITFDSIAYITNPLAKVMMAGICIGAMVIFMHNFFPILTTFINERVNTVSLQDTFLKARPESKLNFLAIIILALSILFGLIFSAKAQTNPRECIITTAKAEVGTLEKGGNNRGAKIDLYRSVCLNKTIKGYSDPWCGYFVSYVYKSCNIPYTVKFSPRARDWFSDPKKVVWKRNFKFGIVKHKPQAGDVVGYIFNSGAVGHIEIITEWNEESGYFLCIGGNTSNKNSVYRDADANDGVRYKKRNIQTAYVVANHIDKL